MTPAAPTYDALDDFAGPGGWDEGARLIGLTTYGVDYDKAACDTARAAGHARELHDVTTHDSTPFIGTPGYISSPSCTLFSPAGKGTGRSALGILSDAVVRIFADDDCRTEVREQVYAEVMLPARQDENDARAPEKRKTTAQVEQAARDDAKIACLVLEPARRIMELDPEWISLEQVASVLPLWQVYARCLRARGYSAYAVVLCAADYGVPQLRFRAVCGASRVRPVAPPPPTHTATPQGDDLFGDGLLPHVCMADALGWGRSDAPGPTMTNAAGRGITGGSNSRKALRQRMASDQWVLHPGERAPVLVSGNQKNAARRSADEPAPTMAFGHNAEGVRWVFERPATTIVGSFKPEVVAAPGYRTKVSRQNAEGSVTITVREAGILQSFRPNYPWQGSKSKQYEQAGNAVPPLLAAHVLAAIVGVEVPALAGVA